MNNLYRLKNAAPNLRKISITDDHTIAERKEIATWISRAKEKTATDTDGNVWKVRGTPDTKLRLVKMTQNQRSDHITTPGHLTMTTTTTNESRTEDKDSNESNDRN